MAHFPSPLRQALFKDKCNRTKGFSLLVLNQLHDKCFNFTIIKVSSTFTLFIKGFNISTAIGIISLCCCHYLRSFYSEML